MKLLALDTATDWCSVALWQDGETISRDSQAERGHGGQLLAMVDELLAQAGCTLNTFDAIAFGRGPGAFTGLRIAASVTQGLAFAAGLPVIPVSDLRALAQRGLAGPGSGPGTRVLVCQDARMSEVYWAGFAAVDAHARAATAEAVARPEDMLAAARDWLGTGDVCGVGSGFAAYPALSALATQLAPLMSEVRPRAQEIAALAAHDGMGTALPAEQALPVYVRNNVATAPAGRTE